MFGVNKEGVINAQRKPRREPNTVCDWCGKPIYKRPSQLKKQKGKFCSRACRNKAYPPDKRPPNAYSFPKGERNPSWKGGVTYKRPKGNYKGVKYVRCPEEFLYMARKDGYISEHRLVMAQYIGRLLKREEVVHHIDHNPSNNDISNLMLFPSNKAHKKYEGKIAKAKQKQYRWF